MEPNTRQVLIYPGEDGYFVAEVPSLPGCVSQGKTYSEALENIKEAIALWIEGAIADGEVVPPNVPLHVETVAVMV